MRWHRPLTESARGRCEARIATKIPTSVMGEIGLSGSVTIDFAFVKDAPIAADAPGPANFLRGGGSLFGLR